MNNEEAKQRVIKNLSYIVDLKPSKIAFNLVEVNRIQSIAKFVLQYVNGEEITMKEKPKDIVEEARELFNTK